MDNDLKKKYKTLIDSMKILEIDEHEIEKKIFEIDDLKDWKPITLRELMNMTDNDISQLKSYCWHDGDYRCDSIGIRDLDIRKKRTPNNDEYWIVSYSDNNGDPNFKIHSLDDPIKKVGDDEWSYGLFKEK